MGARNETAKIEAELAVDGVECVHGVTFDGERLWFVDGDAQRLVAADPKTGKELRRLDVQVQAGTAFDGTHLWQISGDKILKIVPATGEVVHTIPAPVPGGTSGLAFADGHLWAGLNRQRRIVKLDPQTGEIRKTVQSPRFVTGVTFDGDQLWHGTCEPDGRDAALLQLDPGSGEVLDQVPLPDVNISGLESDRAGGFWYGDHDTGRLRSVKRPRGKR